MSVGPYPERMKERTGPRYLCNNATLFLSATFVNSSRNRKEWLKDKSSVQTAKCINRQQLYCSSTSEQNEERQEPAALRSFLFTINRSYKMNYKTPFSVLLNLLAGWTWKLNLKTLFSAPGFQITIRKISFSHSNLTTARRIRQRKYSVSRNIVRHLRSAEMLQKPSKLAADSEFEGALFLCISTVPRASQRQLGHAKTLMQSQVRGRSFKIYFGDAFCRYGNTLEEVSCTSPSLLLAPSPTVLQTDGTACHVQSMPLATSSKQLLPKKC